MLEAFQKQLASLVKSPKKENYLLAVSGGVDSMVMANLFIESGFDMGIAHCNFGLRGKESDRDEAFVKAFAKKNKVPFYSIQFNTKAYADKHKVSIQMAARELRYKWFQEIREKHNYSFLAIAHNSDDVIETFFINLMRGTGIAGLHGIASSNKQIIRPLLGFTREEIETYARFTKTKWREDSSNASDKYERNKIRHHLVPLLAEINPGSIKGIHYTIENLRTVEQVYLQTIHEQLKHLKHTKNGKTYLSIMGLKKLETPELYIYEAIKGFGFNYQQVMEIRASLDKQSGKTFNANGHRLTRDRNHLIVEPAQAVVSGVEKYRVQKGTKVLSIDDFDIDFSTDSLPKGFKPPTSPLTACLDHSKLKFPLTIRKWQRGDRFYPLGMNKPKKVSNFLIDNKVPLPDKDHIYVLLSGPEIAWVIGHRIDNRFKIVPATKKLYICNIERIKPL
jgi:tRNA(Ile)-lysidine synthase